MVNDALTVTADERQAAALRAARDAERALALSYAPPDARAGLTALFALDTSLGDVLRGSREPMLVQMRLTWWHDGLTGLDSATPPAMPVLQALAADVLPRGVGGAALAELVEGWEALADGDPADPAVRSAFAAGRGGVLFAQAAEVAGTADFAGVPAAGQGWALADLALGLVDPVAAAAARQQAGVLLAQATAMRWPRRIRALGALAHIAAIDMASDPSRPAIATPRRVARLAWHRITGL